MNANAKALVAALRSGEYKQGRAQLRRENEFCCLGVACDLHSKATGHKWDDRSMTTVTRRGTQTYLGEMRVLPGAVTDWLGFSDEEGSFMVRISGMYVIEGSAKSSSLVIMNDEEDRSFDEIADVIESEPEGLFV